VSDQTYFLVRVSPANNDAKPFIGQNMLIVPVFLCFVRNLGREYFKGALAERLLNQVSRLGVLRVLCIKCSSLSFVGFDFFNSKMLDSP